MEIYKLYLMLFLAIVFVSYIISIVIKFGVLPSISDSYYRMKHKALFTLFIWAIAFPAIIVGETALMFFCGGLLMFVGAAPAFKKEMEGQVHMIGAIGGIVMGMASMWVDFGLWQIPTVMAIFTAYAIPKEVPKFLKMFDGIPNHTWWVEIMAFVLLAFGLFKERVFMF